MTTAVRSNAAPRGRHAQTADGVQLVGFRLGQEEYGVEITKVREVILPGEITRVPQAPEHVRGLISLRGEVIPVVDLRRRLGLPSATGPTDETRVIVVRVADKTLGMVVDAVGEVLWIAREKILPPPPAVAGVGREYLRGLVRLDNRLLVLLDIDQLLGP